VRRQVLVLFKDWITKQRPSIDIEEVATGETWFGPDALSRNLVDRLSTSDDVLLDRIDEVCRAPGTPSRALAHSLSLPRPFSFLHLSRTRTRTASMMTPPPPRAQNCEVFSVKFQDPSKGGMLGRLLPGAEAPNFRQAVAMGLLAYLGVPAAGPGTPLSSLNLPAADPTADTAQRMMAYDAQLDSARARDGGWPTL
jgi:hypothetical protein